MKLSDLICDPDGTMSHTKIINIVGFLVQTFVFVWAVMTNTNVNFEMFLIYTVQAQGPRAISKLLDVMQIKKGNP